MVWLIFPWFWEFTSWWYHVAAVLVFFVLLLEDLHQFREERLNGYRKLDDSGLSFSVSLFLPYLISAVLVIAKSVFWIVALPVTAILYDMEQRKFIKESIQFFENNPPATPDRKANP